MVRDCRLNHEPPRRSAFPRTPLLVSRSQSSLPPPPSSLPRRREPSSPDALDARLRGHDVIVAHYALNGLPNKVLAAEYQTVLPDEIEKTRRELEARRIGRGGDAGGGV